MAINAPPNLTPIVGQGSLTLPEWAIFFTQVWKTLTGGGGPLPLPAYTLGALPTAGGGSAASLIFVSNATGGAVPAYSDGINWRRVTDGTIVN